MSNRLGTEEILRYSDFIAEIAVMLADAGRIEDCYGLTDLASNDLHGAYKHAQLYVWRGIRFY